MPKEIDKRCCVCDVALVESNWRGFARRNWVNKCVDCLRAESREYQRRWRARNPKESSIRTLRRRDKLRLEDPIKARAESAYGDCRKRGIKCGMPVDITSAFILKLMRETKVCPYFGWALTFERGMERTLASVDRIDSTGGYTQDNVRIISYLANMMKSYASEDELVRFANGVIAEHGDSVVIGLSGMRSYDKKNGTASK